jgi:hypothetical protein
MKLPFKVDDIISVKEHKFNELALKIFRYQARFCPVYRTYLDHLNKDIESIVRIQDIPYLPVDFFKTHKIIHEGLQTEGDKCFKSSSTTQTGQSHHYYQDLSWYEHSMLSGFKKFYGDPKDWEILALLPGYNENPHASLIWMAKELMGDNQQFYLDDFDNLRMQLDLLATSSKKVMLLGVSHALLDFAEDFPGNYNHVVFVETGGMKGRKKEITRNELHQILIQAFEVDSIHSEYGMTELFSQAYSQGNGSFRCPPWMKIRIREMDDAFQEAEVGVLGGINIIDLANLESCCFIATGDVGKMKHDGTFEVLGRFDHSDVRGCNVLIK